ncbi:MAG: radical SAM-associated putative lipoprotein, partial [Tannerella sp.]|nr:radical SAM-associated putative lipoprotein [Tannerella sp.]
MKKVIKTTNAIISLLLGILGFSNCDNDSVEHRVEYGTPFADFTVKGKVTDNVTKKPVKGIRIMYEEPRFGTMYGVPQTSYVPKSTVS